eukprot:992980-Amphidinium_carterae.1
MSANGSKAGSPATNAPSTPDSTSGAGNKREMVSFEINTFANKHWQNRVTLEPGTSKTGKTFHFRSCT